MILLLMGVSGCGKSSVAAELAARTGWIFVEGDEYHSAENRAKMAAGIALTDADRAPWLDALHKILASWSTANQGGILTCSALKRGYRDRLFAGLHETKLIWLDPPRAILEERLKNRTGHFMSPNLLASQLATLESPTPDEIAIHITDNLSANLIAEEIIRQLVIK
jgi:carbohydrate kinase (thermoresistant glucokinase family)